MNIAATGQTRRTGKTTALEAIITRGKFTCLTFRTKRGETGFLRGVQTRPFYKPRADWGRVKQRSSDLHLPPPTELELFAHSAVRVCFAIK
jgi:hypothetical protein